MTWQEIRHQVAIAGQVSDAQTNDAIGGALVTISSGPPAFGDWLAIRANQYGDRWASLAERPDQARTAADGQFHFLDLPDGEYTVTAALPAAGSRYGTAQVQATVSRDGQGRIALAGVTIALPATALKGQITGPKKQPVAMVAVRPQGTSATTFSDANGAYLLTGLEVGSQTLQVSAAGYQGATRTVQLSSAGSVVTENVVLAAATS